jgi:hypothetical protein
MNKIKSNQIFNVIYVVLGFVILNKILEMFSSLTGENLQEGEKEQDQGNIGATESELQNSLLSYPESEYFDLADTIYTALQAEFNEDEDAIYTAFRRLKTDADYLKLKLVYGKRPIGLWGFRNDLNLVQSLRSLLNDQELYYVNRILAKAGIKYRV